MGCVGSTNTGGAPVNGQWKGTDKNIGQQMVNEERSEKRVQKLLLLGTGSSGKSTLFKSLKILDAQKTDEEEKDLLLQSMRENSIHVIRQNCVQGFLTLLRKSQELYDSDHDRYQQCLVDLEADKDKPDGTMARIEFLVRNGQESFQDVQDWDETGYLGPCIEYLWQLPAIQATFRYRNAYSLPDNMDYFFNKINEIMTPDYEPTVEDMLKCRVRTTGFVHYTYTVQDATFCIYDVGGQRNERKKWIHQFSDVAAVIFVCALNHYHAVLFEDEKKNAMHEAIELFTELCNSKWFNHSSIILFLNKDDLFREKLKLQIPLSTCFNVAVGWEGEQWNGRQYTPIENDPVADKQHFDECYQEAIDFIRAAFHACNSNTMRTIYTHVTDATDQDTVARVFWDVQNIVIRQNLQKGGLLA